ncbi:TPA: hypothetical protein NJZ52_003811 [Vibrio parahaemolyticus]|nr:hypothetical protein [Vibrio parahaemolyticus]
MTENEIREHFEKVGYKGRSIVDVWFQNWDKIRPDLERKHPTLSQKIETHIRWKTDTGKKVLAEILTYIETKKKRISGQF